MQEHSGIWFLAGKIPVGGCASATLICWWRHLLAPCGTALFLQQEPRPSVQLLLFPGLCLVVITAISHHRLM